ncbi:MAG: hypothetical protein GX921_06985 [Bacteroidales bacterium]|nr:hypothetical protein [Bacteroidales bacterium]
MYVQQNRKGVDAEMTPRDLEILSHLYKVKVMSINQIHRLYFPNSSKYASKRMNHLRKLGYVTTKAKVVGKGRKETSCYYVTDKGIREVGIETTVPASTMLLGKLQDYRLKVSELFVNISLSPWSDWYWLDSKEVKKEFKLNRSTNISGGLQEINTERKERGKMPTYGVYVITNHASENKIKEIRREIENISKGPLNKFIIFCEGNEEGTRNDNYTLFGVDKLEAVSLMKVPYRLGLKLIPLLGPRKEGIRLITKEVLNTYPVKSDTITPFADQAITVNNEEYYFVELLTNDLATRYFLKEYAQEVTDKKILALVFEHQVQEYKDAFRNNTNIHLCPVSPNLIDKLASATEDNIV